LVEKDAKVLHFSYVFSIITHLQQGDALSLMLFKEACGHMVVREPL
jgi:hypothetical protein